MRGLRPALLGLLLLSTVAHAEQQLAVYPGAVHTRIGNELVIGGQLHRIAYFLTDDPVKKVAEHFHRQWREQGLPTTFNAVGPEEFVVSSFRTREGLQRSVILRRHGNKTLGFTVLKDLWVEVKPPSAPFLALENTLLASDMVARDDGGNMQHRSLVVEGTLSEVTQRLSRGLTQAGFHSVRRTEGQEGALKRVTLEFSRRGEQMVSVVSELGDGRLAVLQSWIGSDRPDGVANDVALDALRRGEGAR
jgi:hypothetical protein